jgi:hypothetical protein
MRKAVIPALLMLALMAPSFAAEEKGAAKPAEGKAGEGHSSEGKSGETKKGGKPGTNVDMPYLIAPLTNADGKLIGYAYLSSRLTAMSDTIGLAVRDKLPFIQDAMLRDVNAEPISTADDPEKVDIQGVEKRLFSDAAKVMGAGKVRLFTLCTVQISPLRPVETPALNAPPEGAAPSGPAPKNPVKSRCES